METEELRQAAWAIEPRAGWIEPVAFDPGDALRFADAPGVYPLVDIQETIRDDAVLAYCHTVLKLNDASQLEAAAQHLREIHGDCQRYVIHAVDVIRGDRKFSVLAADNIDALRRETRLESHITDNMLTVSLTIDDLRVGDLLEFERTLITTRGAHPLRVEHYHDIFWLTGRLPAVRLRLRLVNRSGRDLALQCQRIDDGRPASERARLEPGREMVREYRDLSPQRLPETAPAWWWTDHLQASRAQGWADISRYLYRYYERGGLFAADIDMATFDRVELTGERAVDVVRLVRFVQNQIRYRGEHHGIYTHTPKPAPRVLARGAGDCKDKANLLLALLRAIGVDANLALVNTRYGKVLRERLPSAYLFDHMIVRVELDGVVRYFDATAQKQAGDYARAAELDYGYALNLAVDGEDLAEMPYRLDQPVYRLHQRFDLREAADGVGQLTITREYRAHRADGIRNCFATHSASEIARDWLDCVRDDIGCDIEIATPVSVERDDVDANRLVTTEVYTLRRLDQQPANGWIEINTVFIDDYPLPQDPGFPVQLRADGEVEHEIEVEYPRAPSVKDSVANVANAHFAYRDEFRREGRVLRSSNRATPHRQVVAASDVPAYRDDVERMRARGMTRFEVLPCYPRRYGRDFLAAILAVAAVCVVLAIWLR